MDANTLGFIIFGVGILLAWIALKTTFFGIKLIAGMWWFIVFMYLKTNPPTAITQGSGLHTSMLLVSIGIGLIIVLAGLGRGIQRTEKWNNGEQTSEGFHWKLPDFLNASEDNPEQRGRKIDEELARYRDTMQRALRTGQYKKRRY